MCVGMTCERRIDWWHENPRPQKTRLKQRLDEATDAIEPTEIDDPAPSESTDEPPVIIEAEATEVDETTEEDVEAPVAEEEPTETDEPGEDTAETPAPPPAPAPEPSRSGTSFFALMLGGIVAGGLGYLAATQFPIAPAPEAVDTSAFSEGIAENTSQLAALSSRDRGIGERRWNSRA